MSDVLKPLIGIAADRALTRAEAEAAFAALFDGAATPAQMGGGRGPVKQGGKSGFRLGPRQRAVGGDADQGL